MYPHLPRALIPILSLSLLPLFIGVRALPEDGVVALLCCVIFVLLQVLDWLLFLLVEQKAVKKSVTIRTITPVGVTQFFVVSLCAAPFSVLREVDLYDTMALMVLLWILIVAALRTQTICTSPVMTLLFGYRMFHVTTERKESILVITRKDGLLPGPLSGYPISKSLWLDPTDNYWSSDMRLIDPHYQRNSSSRDSRPHKSTRSSDQ